MKRFGLIGKNISYSLSPKLHNLIASVNNLNISYELIDINSNELLIYINKLKEGIYNGYNVTIPYKEEIIPFLDELTNAAKAIGAVNTIYYKDNKLIGDNTDYLGFDYTLSLSNALNDNLKDVYVMGSGGAAKSVYYALNKRNIKPVIVSRDSDNSFFKNVITYEDFKEVINIDLIINTTPIGNIDNPGVLFEKDNKNIKTIIDLTYNPTQTLLMDYSTNSYSGLEMLIFQAIESQKRWHNKPLKDDKKTINKIKGGLL